MPDTPETTPATATTTRPEERPSGRVSSGRKRRWLPDNVTAYADRHGRTRYRFRKRGCPDHHFRAAPGTPEFLEEYHAALAAAAEPGGGRRYAAFSYDALIASFYRTPRFLALKPATQATYRGTIERFRAKNGSKDARRMGAAAIDAKLGRMAATPGAANNLRKALSRLHRHAIRLGWRADNPVAATDPYPEGPGFHCWSEEEIAAFEARWPLGSRERLAFALLLYTALRKGDMVTVGRQHRVQAATAGGRVDELHLRHSKNDSRTVVPVTPALAAALETVPAGQLTYLVTGYGKPFTAKGFGHWFRKRCDLAGLPQCSAHGLRKAMSRRLAEAGATSLEGRAITGHKTDREFANYAESASKTALGKAAVAKLLANRPTPALANLPKNLKERDTYD